VSLLDPEAEDPNLRESYRYWKRCLLDDAAVVMGDVPPR
jgi:hypothetical protein